MLLDYLVVFIVLAVVIFIFPDAWKINAKLYFFTAIDFLVHTRNIQLTTVNRVCNNGQFIVSQHIIVFRLTVELSGLISWLPFIYFFN